MSRICQQIDRKLNRDWTAGGVQAAVKILLTEKNTLFDDMGKNLEKYDELREFIRSILIDGELKRYQTDNPVVDFGVMFGYFKNNDGQIAIANKIFELRMTNYFISKSESDFTQKHITGVLKEDIVIDGKGFYHIEAQTRNTKRMDIIVDYGTDQFIVDLKLWRGESSHEKAYEQLLGYMDGKNADTGYLLTFDFSKKPKQRKPQWVDWKGKKILDVIV